LHWVQEEADFRGRQRFQGDGGSVGLHCRDGVVVETIDDSRERMIITSCKEVLLLHG
jgi:ribosomal protein L21E